MNSDTLALIGGVTISALIAEVSPVGVDIFEIIKTLGSTGALAIVVWWIMQRVEKRIDKAFTEYTELVKELMQMLKDKDEQK